MSNLVKAADAVHWLNRIEVDADGVIAELPSYDDETVLEIRQQARTVRRVAWRIEIAADAEIMRRTAARLARGRYDVEGRQIAEKVRAVAAQMGVTTRVIELNAKAHRVFFSSETGFAREIEGIELLDEKKYFFLAMEHDDPRGTIEAFAEAKASNPRFNTVDAERWVKEGKTPNLNDTPRAALDSQESLDAYQNWRIACAALGREVPFWRGILRGYVEELEYEASKPSETWQARIIDKIIMGTNTVEMLARELGLDRIHMTVMLNRLCESAVLVEMEQQRAPGARGAAQRIYCLNPDPV